MILFYSILNTVGINAHMSLALNQNKMEKRRLFLRRLGEDNIMVVL